MKSLLPVVLLLIAVGGGCSQPPVPRNHYYRLDVEAPSNPSAVPKFEGTIEVGAFNADGLTAGRPIVYSDRKNPHEVLEYYYHFWIEPPAIMLRDQLVEYLRAAGIAGNVVTPEMRVEPDYVITARIKKLEKVINSPSYAAVELELGLRKADGSRLLFVGTYALEVKADNDTIGAAVVAANRALTQIYGEFVADISGI